MCFSESEFYVGSRDVLLGTIEGSPFFIGGAQHKQWGNAFRSKMAELNAVDT